MQRVESLRTARIVVPCISGEERREEEVKRREAVEGERRERRESIIVFEGLGEGVYCECLWGGLEIVEWGEDARDVTRGLVEMCGRSQDLGGERTSRG